MTTTNTMLVTIMRRSSGSVSSAIVGFVRHHNDDGVAPAVIKTPHDRASEAMRTRVLRGRQRWKL